VKKKALSRPTRSPDFVEAVVSQLARAHINPRTLGPKAARFPARAGNRLAAAMADLWKRQPGEARASVLALFGGMSAKEIEDALGGAPGSKSAPQVRSRAWLREQVGNISEPTVAKMAVSERGPRTQGPEHAFATLARHPIRGNLVVTPIGPQDANDKTLAKSVSRFLRQHPDKKAAIQDRLEGLACFFSVESFVDDVVEDDLVSLLKQMAKARKTPLGTGASIDREGLVSLTLIDVRCIQEEMERMGRGPRKKAQEGTPGDVAPEDRIPKPDITLEEIEQLLTNASPTSPVSALSGFESLLQSLHGSRLVPGLQRYLDQVQQEAAQLPGGNFGSFEENKSFVDALRATLRRLDVRLECSTCHRPATLIVKLGGTTTGSFLFRHRSADLRTDHGGKTSLPPLELTTASDTTEDD